MAAIFACIVQPKVIEFNVADQKLHRAQKDEELRLEVEALSLLGAEAPQKGAAADGHAGAAGPANRGMVLSQPGGACRLLTRDSSVSVATVGSAVCVFEGTLTNAEALAEAYAPVPEDEPSPQAASFSGAELMCHMYAKVGVEMLGLLRGTFTFVLYESKTSRVLAARDGSGWCPLLQARTARSESLILSNSRELLEACGSHDILEFLPGDYKYGWSATPRRYQPADHAKLSRRSLDLVASPHHHPNHHGPNVGQPPSRGGSRRASLDHHQDAGAGVGAGAGKPRRRSTDHGHTGGHAGANGARGSQGSPQQQPPAPHPHRTYVVSAEDSRIVKATATPARPEQAAATTAGNAAAAAPPSPAAPSTQVAGAAAHGSQEKAVGPGGTASRGGSARGAASGHHNRRRSMDNQGAWRLGAGQAVTGAAKTGAAALGPQQRTPSQQHQGGKQQAGPRQQAGDAGCGGGGDIKQQGTPGSAGRRRGGGGGGGGNGNGGGGGAGREGQHGSEARAPPKPQQPPVAEPTAAASDAVPRADPDPANLRVDAPPFTPPWMASAPGASAAVAVGGSP